MALALVVGGVVVVDYARDHWNGLYDDTFIYLRYVRNLHSGCGLRFNCSGQAVEGFTSPLYLAVLWLGSFLTTGLIDLSQIVCTAAVIATIGLALLVVARLAKGSWAAPLLVGALALALVLDDFVLLNAITGMETALAAAVITGLAYAVVSERPRLLAALACSAVLARPEALLFVVALPLLPWMRRWRLLGACAAFVAALCLLRLGVFGEVLPNTYYAKAGGTWRHASLGLSYIADGAIDFPLSFLAPLALFAGPRPAASGRTTPRRACAYLLVVAAGWLAFFLRSGGDLFEYSRLWFPLVPALSALALYGLANLPIRAGAAAIAVIAAGVLAARAAVFHAIPPQGASPRVVQWIAVGTYLRTHYPKGTLVATVPIGAIGYYSSLPILDLVGLTEPAIARAGRSVPPELLTKLWIGHERNNLEYVLAREPKVIVTTMVRDTPWTLPEAKAGFYADWLLLQAIKRGEAPYDVRDVELAPGEHVLMFERRPKT